jgi:hypothetical protein
MLRFEERRSVLVEIELMNEKRGARDMWAPPGQLLSGCRRNWFCFPRDDAAGTDSEAWNTGSFNFAPYDFILWCLVVGTSVRLAVPNFRRLVAGFSPWSSGFAPRTVHMEFVLDKVAMGKFSLRVLQFSPVSIIPPLLHIHSCIIWTMGPLASAVPSRQSHPVATIKTVSIRLHAEHRRGAGSDSEAEEE